MSVRTWTSPFNLKSDAIASMAMFLTPSTACMIVHVLETYKQLGILSSFICLTGILFVSM